MHELSLCGSIVDIVRKHAAPHRVVTIHVQVGQLRQVVPDTLAYCWQLVSADSALAGSVLEVERIRARITCLDCGASGEVGDLRIFACGACSSPRVSVVAGEEFLITSLELAEV